MIKPYATLTVLLLCVWPVLAQDAPTRDSEPLPRIEVTSESGVEFQFTNGFIAWTNHVQVRFLDTNALMNAVLEADNVSINTNSGEVIAAGGVRLQQNDETLVGPQLQYNYLTRQMDWTEFRAGVTPFFAAGRTLTSEGPSHQTTGTNVMLTTDDYEKPLQKIRAKEVTIVPGQYLEARHAVVYIGSVPVFYWPYYHQDLSGNPNRFTFLVGDRSLFGPYLLSTYHWHINPDLTASLHADVRERRGFGFGPDLAYDLGQWGIGTAKYYYTHDRNTVLDPFTIAPPPPDRQRAYFSYDATPAPGLTLKSQVAWESDSFIVHDFFETEYRKDIQPKTFFEGNQAWPNWSLDALAQPRINRFYDTVERLPDVRLTGFRQQVFGTPVYYESETSGGYYQRLFSNTNSFFTNYAATRADTFQQLTLPETFFGWLNVTPRAGGRFTYYGTASGAGATTTEEKRAVFNAGVEFSFKATRLWPEVKNSLFDVNGLRHIFQPSLNYVYIPRPNVLPAQVPQFDYEFTNSLEMLPLEFPDFNSIDAIDRQNTIRFGLGNRLQTKRNGEIEDLVNWQVYTDWHLRPSSGQTTFSDIFSEFEFRPRSWLLFDSKTRYDIDTARFNLAQHQITFQPNNVWSWSLGHFFLRNDPQFGTGVNAISSTFFFRLNENWGTRIQHMFDARSGTLQEQDYTIYRDLRSWTAALTFRALDDQTKGTEFGVALSVSLKAFPKYGVGQDTVSVSPLLGY